MRAFGFALSVASGCALVIGLVPAVRVAGTDLAGGLRSGKRTTGGRRLRHLQGSLVVAQVSAALVLTVGAALFVRSFSRLSAVDPGYRIEGMLSARVGAPQDLYTDRSSRATLFRRLERRVRSLPGVQRVGTTFRPPFTAGELSVPVRLADGEGTLEQAPRADIGIVSPCYLEALEIPLLRGRNFTNADREDSPRVALLSASLARELYGDEDPVGRRLTPVLGAWDSATNWAEVVGVVGDIRLELGVRVAFGADRGSVVRLVVAQGMTLVAVGLGIGVGVTLMASRALSGLLFEIAPTDPATYGWAVLGVTTIALAGCLLPAFRAARGDVIGALSEG